MGIFTSKLEFLRTFDRQTGSRSRELSRSMSSNKGPRLLVASTLHATNYVVALAEEGEPLVQHRLLLIIQIIPGW
jgi:hypothetical protein